MDFNSTKTAAKYCRECGSLLPKSSAQRQKQIAEMYAAYGESIKFCNECGMPLFPDGKPYKGYSSQSKRQKSETKQKQTDDSYNSRRRRRETVYEGELHKCPNCGKLLDAFVTVCPDCGYEIRGASAAYSVHDFSIKFQSFPNNKNGIEQKIKLIRTFPIPSTKEDILEFFFIASSNVDGNAVISDSGEEAGNDTLSWAQNIAQAWMAKLEQCYLKAKLLFGNDPNFNIVQSTYNNACKKYKKYEKKRGRNHFWTVYGLGVFLPLLIIATFIILIIIGFRHFDS